MPPHSHARSALSLCLYATRIHVSDGPVPQIHASPAFLSFSSPSAPCGARPLFGCPLSEALCFKPGYMFPNWLLAMDTLDSLSSHALLASGRTLPFPLAHDLHILSSSSMVPGRVLLPGQHQPSLELWPPWGENAGSNWTRLLTPHFD